MATCTVGIEAAPPLPPKTLASSNDSRIGKESNSKIDQGRFQSRFKSFSTRASTVFNRAAPFL